MNLTKMPLVMLQILHIGKRKWKCDLMTELDVKSEDQ